MSGDCFTGWGIRTLAAGEVRYNPMSYHNGSIWPHDNAMIALGFARYGLVAEAARLFEGLYAAGGCFELRRLPELFCGFTRRRDQRPTPYPVACSPQAWAAATLPALVQGCLGLSFQPENGTVRLDQPRLPAFLTRLTIRNLTLNGAVLTLGDPRQRRTRLGRDRGAARRHPSDPYGLAWRGIALPTTPTGRAWRLQPSCPSSLWSSHVRPSSPQGLTRGQRGLRTDLGLFVSVTG